MAAKQAFVTHLREIKEICDRNLEGAQILILVTLALRCPISNFRRFLKIVLKALGNVAKAICKRLENNKQNCERNLNVPRFGY